MGYGRGGSLCSRVFAGLERLLFLEKTPTVSAPQQPVCPVSLGGSSVEGSALVPPSWLVRSVVMHSTQGPHAGSGSQLQGYLGQSVSDVVDYPGEDPSWECTSCWDGSSLHLQEWLMDMERPCQFC